MLELARRRGVHDRLVEADVRASPLERGAYDLVTGRARRRAPLGGRGALRRGAPPAPPRRLLRDRRSPSLLPHDGRHAHPLRRAGGRTGGDRDPPAPAGGAPGGRHRLRAGGPGAPRRTGRRPADRGGSPVGSRTWASPSPTSGSGPRRDPGDSALALEPRDPPPLPWWGRPWPLLSTSVSRSRSPAASPPLPGSTSLSTRVRSSSSWAPTGRARPACCAPAQGFCPSPPVRRRPRGRPHHRPHLGAPLRRPPGPCRPALRRAQRGGERLLRRPGPRAARLGRRRGPRAGRADRAPAHDAGRSPLGRPAAPRRAGGVARPTARPVVARRAARRARRLVARCSGI